MVQSKAKTVKEYLAELPEDRRAAIQAVREVVLKNLDDDFEEGMTYGMIGYYVPHSLYPPGYHCDPCMPLPFANLASQKNHMALYLMCLYGDTAQRKWFEAEWKKAGKKFDMGKACLRFKKVEDLALDIIGQTIRQVSAKKYIENCERALGSRQKAPAKKAAAMRRAGKSVSAKKTTPKSARPAGKR
ncbi:MAG TPA: DUF1801 domain-containing protein [Planctomycetaceae bacterium]|jgi:hypothetical protein|nr:DUF1801 domain-containing protein [Planctomycetaceae bacterium]